MRRPASRVIKILLVTSAVACAAGASLAAVPGGGDPGTPGGTIVPICRTAGFWGTHGGDEKGGTNITLGVIALAPQGLAVCGRTVNNTTVLALSSALEALCVSPQGDALQQLARQLTAAALNCALSGAATGCDGVPGAESFAACNDVCAGAGDPALVGSCIAAIDCFNNGGTWLGNGLCQRGTCATAEALPCDDDARCGLDPDGNPIACVPTADTCHDHPLTNDASFGEPVSYEPPGPASSAGACNQARKSACNLLSCP